MPRPCSVCNLEEYRLQIDQRLRDGESCSVIAEEFNVSEDSVQRHRTRHIRRDLDVKGTLNAADILHSIVSETGEIASNARTVGDMRAALQALAQQASAMESLLRLEETKAAEAAAKAEDAPALTIEQLDRHIRAVQEQNYDYCPTCHQRTLIKFPLTDASGQKSGHAYNCMIAQRSGAHVQTCCVKAFATPNKKNSARCCSNYRAWHVRRFGRTRL